MTYGSGAHFWGKVLAVGGNKALNLINVITLENMFTVILIFHLGMEFKKYNLTLGRGPYSMNNPGSIAYGDRVRKFRVKNKICRACSMTGALWIWVGACRQNLMPSTLYHKPLSFLQVYPSNNHYILMQQLPKGMNVLWWFGVFLVSCLIKCYKKISLLPGKRM